MPLKCRCEQKEAKGEKGNPADPKPLEKTTKNPYHKGRLADQIPTT